MDIFERFGVSPNDYEYDPVNDTIKRKPATFDERWSLPVRPPMDIIGDVPNVPTNTVVPNPKSYIPEQPELNFALPVELSSWQKSLTNRVPEPIVASDSWLNKPFSKGDERINQIFGMDDRERFQTFPERMVRSGATLASDLITGKLPVDLNDEVTMEPNWLGQKLGMTNTWSAPSPHSLIGRAQDLSGMAGMSTLGIKPGTASVGSGAVRPLMEDSKPATALASLKLKSEQFGLTQQEYLKQLSANEQLKIFDELDAKNAKLSPTEKMHYDYLEGKLGELESVVGKPKTLPEGYELTKDGDKWGVIPPGQQHGKPLNGLHPTQEAAIEAALNSIPKAKPIQLDNGLKLVPVRHNPFEELETGIREAAKGVTREEKLKPSRAELDLLDKRKDIIQKQLDEPKNRYNEELFKQLEEIRQTKRKIWDRIDKDNLPTQEFTKIGDIALNFVDKWNPKAREKRAERQGFEDEVYHGAKEGWRDLEVRAPRDYGFYASRQPELANEYAGKSTNNYREPNIMPLKINTKEYITVDADGQQWHYVNEPAIAKARAEGKKGVIIENVYDEPASSRELGAPKTVYIALDPTTVRSKFAKFDPENVGRNGILFEDSKAGLALGALNQSGFYSNLERTVANSKVQKGTPEQWTQYLKNQPGIKPDELEFSLSGLGEGVITKEQLAQHIKENGTKIDEVWKGSTDQTALFNRQVEIKNKIESINAQLETMRRQPDSAENAQFISNLSKERSQLMNEHGEIFDKLNENDKPKFSAYQLPGGDNYRELLLTVPEKQNFGVKQAEGMYRLYDYKNNDYVKTPDGKLRTGYTSKKEAELAAKGLNDTSGLNPMGNYQSSHWDEPNVLAHIRMNDRDIGQQGYVVQNLKSGNRSKIFGTRDEAVEYLRTLPESVMADVREVPNKLKTLHIEEIQSDWHQAGRKQGYKDEKKLAELEARLEEIEKEWKYTNEYEKKVGQVPETIRNIEDYISSDIAWGDGKKFSELPKTEQDQLVSLLNRWKKQVGEAGELPKRTTRDISLDRNRLNEEWNVNYNDTVPNAPFKKTWDELALKRVITEAVKNDYDAISWTPGEAQAARYDLSKQVERIHFTKTDDGQFLLAPETKSGHEAAVNNGQAIPKEKLADYIGKEIAEKIIAKTEKAGDFKPLEELPKGYEVYQALEKELHDGTIKPYYKVKTDEGYNVDGYEHFTTKEAAKESALKRINRQLAEKYQKENNVLENVDLKIGGEGMKAFYDKMLVDKANALVKKMGGKVEYENLPNSGGKSYQDILKLVGKTSDEWKALDASERAKILQEHGIGQKIPIIKLTPKMKEEIKTKGFPLFSAGVPTFTPVDTNPWEKKQPKLVPIDFNPFSVSP